MFICSRFNKFAIYLTLISGYIIYNVFYIQKHDHYQIRYLISTFALSFNVSRFVTNIIEINKQCMKIIKGLKLKAPQLRGDKGMIKERREKDGKTKNRKKIGETQISINRVVLVSGFFLCYFCFFPNGFLSFCLFSIAWSCHYMIFV